MGLSEGCKFTIMLRLNPPTAMVQTSCFKLLGYIILQSTERKCAAAVHRLLFIKNLILQLQCSAVLTSNFSCVHWSKALHVDPGIEGIFTVV